MAETIIVSSINRNTEYPVYQDITAKYCCGTVKIIIDDTYTEQMLAELPNITINIYTESDGEKVLYTSRALTMTIPNDSNSIESVLIDIPTSCILALIPEFDNNAIISHNSAVCTNNEGTMWTDITTEFPITIIWDDTNVYAEQSGGGSGEASNVSYDNTTSGITATNVQDAIDIVAEAISELEGGIHYIGEVDYYNDLPANPNLGDGYTVKYSGTSGTDLDGTEYVWAKYIKTIEGANLFDYTNVSNIIYDTIYDGHGMETYAYCIHISPPIEVKSGQTYTWRVSADTNTGSTMSSDVSVVFFDSNMNKVGYAANVFGGSHYFSFTVPANAVYVRCPVFERGAEREAVLNKGSSPIPYTPYQPSHTETVTEWIDFSKDTYTKTETNNLLNNKQDKITAGTGLAFGTGANINTLNHSNSTTAKTTQAIYKTSFDAQGHITGSTDLTTAESDAISSGITSEKVTQIQTNTDNIALKLNKTDIITLTKDEYDALPSSKKTDGKYYLITDINSLEPYDSSEVYGWHIDPTESDPALAVTYTNDAVGMTPAYMDFANSKFEYGSWENAFFMPKPCMVKYDGTVDYYLDPNDYTKKLDGTASDVANVNYKGNAMMEWPLIWYKFEGTSTEGEGYFYVSNIQIDNTYKCYCNVNAKNEIKDHFYTAIYNGTKFTDIDDNKVKMRSISGVTLNTTNSATYDSSTSQYADTTTQMQWAMNNDTTSDKQWSIDVVADRLLINALLILVGKSLDCQSVFGAGVIIGDKTQAETYVTGQALNNKGLFWGTSHNNSDTCTQPVKVFGMENWWGLVWHRTLGCINRNADLYIKLTRGTYDGSTLTEYIYDTTTPTSPNYISYGTISTTSNYLVKSSFNQYGMFPKVTSRGTKSTYYCDYYTYSTFGQFAHFGGYSSGGRYSGPFYLNLSYGVFTQYWSIGAALVLKP